jgi:hypothetical protein
MISHPARTLYTVQRAPVHSHHLCLEFMGSNPSRGNLAGYCTGKSVYQKLRGAELYVILLLLLLSIADTHLHTWWMGDVSVTHSAQKHSH